MTEQTIQPIKKKRESNIELLRIFCMMMIVAHHCVIHGGGYAMDNCTNKLIALFFVPAGKICFGTFIAISAWYMVDGKFTAKRFVKIWGEILFYNLVFMGLTALLGEGYADPITWRNWFGAFFPMLGNSHGFAASYAMFCLTVPFLNMVKEKLDRKRALFLVEILFAAQVLSSLMSAVTDYKQPMPSEVVLFILFYFTAFYLKNWPIKLQSNTAALALILVLIWGFVMGTWIGVFYDEAHISTYSRFMVAIGDESGLLNIVAGFALFFLAKKIRIPYSRIINTIATTTFGVLLYHDHNYFRPVVWHRFVKAETWYYPNPPRFIMYFGLAVLAVFTFGMCVDFFRQYFIEKPLLKTRWVQSLCAQLEAPFSDDPSCDP